MTDDDWVGLFVHSPLMGSANGVLYNLRGVEIRIRWLGTRGFRPQGTRYHESWLAEDTVIYTIRLWCPGQSLVSEYSDHSSRSLSLCHVPRVCPLARKERISYISIGHINITRQWKDGGKNKTGHKAHSVNQYKVIEEGLSIRDWHVDYVNLHTYAAPKVTTANGDKRQRRRLLRRMMIPISFVFGGGRGGQELRATQQSFLTVSRGVH